MEVISYILFAISILFLLSLCIGVLLLSELKTLKKLFIETIKVKTNTHFYQGPQSISSENQPIKEIPINDIEEQRSKANKISETDKKRVEKQKERFDRLKKKLNL